MSARRIQPDPGRPGTPVSPSAERSGPLLQVTDLSVTIPTRDGDVKAVEGITFHVDSGEVLGVVGESGSGKSVTGLAILGLLPPRAIVGGSIRFDGTELLDLSPKAMRSRRGRDVAMIFQDPMTALNPVFAVGHQIVEMIRQHRDMGEAEARRHAIDLMDMVGIPEPHHRIDQYPHEFSGGMRQRVVIAIAMANRPRLVIADEPTTALDVTIQAQVMSVMRTVQREVGSALVLITHDLGLVAGTADRIQVMYGGRLMETGPATAIFSEGGNPYTLGLLRSLPGRDRDEGARLFSIPGAPPSAIHRPAGCPFHPRCGYATEVCAAELPGLVEVGDGHTTRCHHASEVAASRGAPSGRERR